MPKQQNTQNSQDSAQNPQNSRDSQNLTNPQDLANKDSANKSAKDSAFVQKLELIKGRFIFVGGEVRGILGSAVQKLSATIAKIKSLNKNILYAASATLALFVVFVIVLIMFLNKEEPLPAIYAPKSAPTQVTLKSTALQKSGEVQSLLQKAALLYESGQVAEALDIYKNISTFSQSFANFNLGVAKLKERNLNDALNAFDGAIQSGENIAAAAINAANIAYQKSDLKKYHYYVNLAQGTLVEWANKPLYSYLYSLVNFYDENYFATLSSLNNPTSQFYSAESALLSAKIYLNFGDEYNALKKLLEVPNIDNRFNIGLLYARMGEFDLASEQISSYLKDYNTQKANMALALIELKRGNYTQSAEIYNALLEKNSTKDLAKIYPIKVKISETLLDVSVAQRTFWERNASSQMAMLWHYKILFYFAPFRVFDADSAIAMINEGGVELKMDNLVSASAKFAQGAMKANIDKQITQGLRAILQNNLFDGKKILLDSAKKYPNHPILQYNLGLIYAQLNDFEGARRHFLKAYHLDSNDILSGIFALMCAQLTQTNSTRIANDISANFEEMHFDSPANEAFYRSLFGYANGNIIDNFAESSVDSPLAVALKALYALGTRDSEVIKSAFATLQKRTNDDIVAQILSHLVAHYGKNIKKHSIDLFDFVKNITHLKQVLGGANFAREIYVYSAFLAGASSYVDKILNDRLLNESGGFSGILQALALNAIYLQDFERAFAYYNELIDAYKVQNSEIYFYAAVSAIGAGNYDNAVALIQLARMDNGANFEARYALGLLHQAMGNLNLASMQFGAINASGFKSDFFDFEIDSSEILNDSTTRTKTAESSVKRVNK
ncbi:tetratricopeptide repeat protein [Helicobacter sp. 23-1045]